MRKQRQGAFSFTIDPEREKSEQLDVLVSHGVQRAAEIYALLKAGEKCEAQSDKRALIRRTATLASEMADFLSAAAEEVEQE
jgi:hypothetical protein